MLHLFILCDNKTVKALKGIVTVCDAFPLLLQQPIKEA